mgnify:CR=1 FL=1
MGNGIEPAYCWQRAVGSGSVIAASSPARARVGAFASVDESCASISASSSARTSSVLASKNKSTRSQIPAATQPKMKIFHAASPSKTAFQPAKPRRGITDITQTRWAICHRRNHLEPSQANKGVAAKLRPLCAVSVSFVFISQLLRSHFPPGLLAGLLRSPPAFVR